MIVLRRAFLLKLLRRFVFIIAANLLLSLPQTSDGHIVPENGRFSGLIWKNTDSYAFQPPRQG